MIAKIKSISRDTMAGIVFLLVGIILLIQVKKISSTESGMLSYFSLTLYFAMAIWIFISGTFGKTRKEKEGVVPYKINELIILLLLIITYLTMKAISFYYLIFPFVFILNLFLTKDFSRKHLLIATIYSMGFTAVIILLCRYCLNLII